MPCRNFYLSEEEMEIRRNCYQHFNITIKMLNESMGMCLPGALESRKGATEIQGPSI